jgi:breast cancer 2 susceptibility protein
MLIVDMTQTDGSTDGAEPLEAYDSSTLVISGNSTSRAPWHAKLGFVYQLNPSSHQVSSPPFICSFRSLLPDGGVVPFVDVKITRVYNKGYKGEYVEGAPQDLWNEEEERERQRNWEVGPTLLRLGQ